MDVLLIGDNEVDTSHQRAHYLLRLRFRPELPAKVQIDRHARPGLLCRLYRFTSAFGGLLAERRGDASDVKPRGVLKDVLPVDGIGLELANRGARAIINDIRGALARTSFHEINTDAIAAAQYEIGFDSFCAQRPDGRLADFVLRHARDVIAVEPEVRQTHRSVRLATTKRRNQNTATEGNARTRAGSAGA